MPTRKLEALYKKVGPALFARAQRALKDDAVAQEVVQEVVIELSRLGSMSDEKLASAGRELLKQKLAKRGTLLDSMNPEKE